MIGSLIREYRIVSEIGEGGMGVVYLAEHSHLGRKCALKIMAWDLARKPQFQERFFKEAKAQAQLNHGNIVQVLDFFKEQDKYFLVMEYVDGPALDELLAKERKLPLERALEMGKDALSALHYAHGMGVIHRDIKSSNLLISEDGKISLTDFGIALLVGESRVTQTGTQVGTAWYMSPEQVLRPKDVDLRTDIYSMGVLLYEMLSGQVPFDGESDYAIKEQHVKERPPSLTEVDDSIPPEVAVIVDKAMAKDPEDRFATADDFRRAIERFQQGLSPLEPGEAARLARVTPPPAAKPKGGKKGLLAAGLLAVLLTAGGGLYWQMNHTSPPVPASAPAAAPAHVVVARIPAALEVQSKPSQATWYLDGQWMGATPGRKNDLEPGSHTVMVQMQGLPQWSRQVELRPGQKLALNADLLAPAAVSGQAMPNREEVLPSGEAPQASGPAAFSLAGTPEAGQLGAQKADPQVAPPAKAEPKAQAVSSRPETKPKRSKSKKSRRSVHSSCQAIIEKISRGEILTAQEKDYYQKKCR